MTPPYGRTLAEVCDILAITEMKSEYCHLTDRGYPGAGDDLAAAAELFTDDAVWCSGPNRAQGRGEILSLLERYRARVPLAIHTVSTPRITVSENTATARWAAIVPQTLIDTSAPEAVWAIGHYDDELIRTPSGWRFSKVEFVAAIRTPFSQSWA